MNKINSNFKFGLFYYRQCSTRYRKKPKYGSRYLIDKSEVFSHNAWYVISGYP